MVSMSISKDVSNLLNFFENLPEDVKTSVADSPLKGIDAIADVIAYDKEMLPLALGTFTKKYPDVSENNLCQMLLLRGDFSEKDAKQTAKEYVPDSVESSQMLTIFGQISNDKALSSLNKEKKFSLNSLNPFSSAKNDSKSNLNNPFEQNKSNLNPFDDENESNSNPFDDVNESNSNPFDNENKSNSNPFDDENKSNLNPFGETESSLNPFN